MNIPPAMRTLRNRVFFMGTATLLTLLLTVYLFSSAITFGSFATLERRLTFRHTQRVRDAIQQRVEQFSRTATEWSQGQEGARVVQGLARQHGNADQVSSALRSAQVDVLAQFSAAGECLSATALPRDGKSAADVLRELGGGAAAPEAIGARLVGIERPAAGLMSLSNGTLLVAIRDNPVDRSAMGSPNILVLGRWLEGDACVAASLAGAELSCRASAHSIPEVTDVDADQPKAARVFVRELDEQQIAGSFQLADVTGRPGLVVRVTCPRELYACARQGLVYLLWGLLLAGIIVGILLRSLLVRLVFERLQRVRDGVTKISRTGDLSLQLDPGGRDEMADLADSINALVRQLAVAQADLRDSRQKADGANEAKGRFLANMSHEIRTPLNGILGFAKLLETGGESVGADERREWVHTICSCSEHLLALINDVLDFSKIEAGRLDLERMRCPFAPLLQEIVGAMRPQAAEKGLGLEIRNLEAAPPTSMTDPTRLRQVLTNLLSNAIKFTERGLIEMVCERVDGGAGMLIHIRDSGCGIPPEQLHAIFDPFVQADNSVTRKFGGTGLGLAISRQIARSLGGDLTVQSAPGSGSTFTLRLPVSEEKPGSRSVPGGAPHAPVRGQIGGSVARNPATHARISGRVLLVEDGDTNRKLIELILRRAGLTVESAENGRIGVEMTARSQYDLILMDMQMPVMDGYAATQTLRRQGVTLPIIALTAHALGGDQTRCTSAGCSGYLSKPVDPELLLRTIAEALGSGHAGAGSAGILPDKGSVGILAQEQGRVGILPARSDGAPEHAAQSEHEAQASGEADSPVTCSLPLDDPDFREIALEFVDRLNEKLQSMQAAVETENLAELGRLAHWLKGAGGTAGFHSFTEPAAKLEACANAAQDAEIAAAVAALRELANRIRIEPAVCEARSA